MKSNHIGCIHPDYWYSISSKYSNTNIYIYIYIYIKYSINNLIN